MAEKLFPAVRSAAKGSGWSVKRDVLSRHIGEHVLAVHPRRGSQGVIEFRAKPISWDHLLWSILQIEGNEQKPASFYFTGAFTCDVPALVQETLENLDDHETTAKQMVRLAIQCSQSPSTWQGYDLMQAIAEERPEQPYQYYMTHVVERICSGDRKTAKKVCEDALSGALDLRHTFSSMDKLSPLDKQGCRPSLSFFQLAQIWMRRH
jgi:hypothetical protein